MTILFLVAGLLFLVAGAEGLVRGASTLAERAGIPSLVVGLTVVAFGTSAPELAVSVGSSLGGQPDVAVGNVVGSNIFNVLFILGISALVAPLTAATQLVRLDVPLCIAVSAGTLLLALNGVIGRGEGLLLGAGIALYTTVLIVQSRSSSEPDPTEEAAPSDEEAVSSATGWAWNLALVVGGLALLVLGARWFVEGAVALSRRFGVSELVIGLTVVAGGTSLPEAATSVLASLRGQRDIAVGNVVGSNLFNLLAVLGLSATVAPDGLPVSAPVLWFDLPVMIAVAVACLPIFFTGYSIARWEGGLFLGYYVAYTTYLVLGATQHDALSTFSVVMGAFVVPLTVVTLAVLSVRAWRAHPPARDASPN
jgi:cation:H+ antiporter